MAMSGTSMSEWKLRLTRLKLKKEIYIDHNNFDFSCGSPNVYLGLGILLPPLEKHSLPSIPPVTHSSFVETKPPLGAPEMSLYWEVSNLLILAPTAPHIGSPRLLHIPVIVLKWQLILEDWLSIIHVSCHFILFVIVRNWVDSKIPQPSKII